MGEGEGGRSAANCVLGNHCLPNSGTFCAAARVTARWRRAPTASNAYQLQSPGLCPFGAAGPIAESLSASLQPEPPGEGGGSGEAAAGRLAGRAAFDVGAAHPGELSARPAAPRGGSPRAPHPHCAGSGPGPPPAPPPPRRPRVENAPAAASGGRRRCARPERRGGGDMSRRAPRRSGRDAVVQQPRAPAPER